MKKLFTVLFFIFIAFVSLAQSKQQTIVLTNGTTIKGVVEKTAEGFYVVKTPDGDEFFFSSSEIRSISSADARGPVTEVTRIAKHQVTEGMSYEQIKDIYKASDYKKQSGDRYNVAKLTSMAMLCPYYRFHDKVSGDYLAMTSAFRATLGGIFTLCGAMGLGDGSTPGILLGVGLGTYFGLGILEAATINRKAKIYNQYYQDLDIIANRGAHLSLNPYLSRTPNTVFCSSSTVAGLSLTLTF